MKCLISAALLGGLLQTGMVSAQDTPAKAAPGGAEHVVVIVWDGMRPDFITPQYTPTLYKLAREGVFFKNHHPVYISSTEVNGTALATGVYPDSSGIMANTDYRPEIGWLQAQGTESVEAVRRGDWLTGGKYLAFPTLPEVLQAAGFPTVVAGTKPVALLLDRAMRRKLPAASNSVNLVKGRTLPSSALAAIIKGNEDKPFPTTVTHPNKDQDAWTTRAVTHTLWKKEVPRLTMLWLSDPDFTQHEFSPGSEQAIGALESCDQNLERILKTLEEKKIREKTDIVIVSDHGFSTIERGPDIADVLKKAKFKATRKFEDPEPGDVLVVGNGGSVSLYVIDDDPIVIRKLVEFFQGCDFAGVIFCRIPVEGAFPMDQVRVNAPTSAPDILVSLRWSDARNDFGTPGMVVADNGKKGKGTHASLSRFDMHNTLVASGPHFRRGLINEMPSGNADVTPTLLHILGVTPPKPLEGRILFEALASKGGEMVAPETKTIKASADLGLYRWEQYLKFTTVGKAIYFDEGNGTATLK